MTIELFIRDAEGLAILKKLDFEPAPKTLKTLLAEKGFILLRQQYTASEELLAISVQGPLCTAERKIIEDLSIQQRMPVSYVGFFEEVYD